MKPYEPSNGTEGMWFTDKFCFQCEKDRKYHTALEPEPEDGCEIIVLAMAYSRKDKEYPEEWIEDDDGSNPRCTAFLEYQEKPKREHDPTAKDRRYRKKAEAAGQMRLI